MEDHRHILKRITTTLLENEMDYKAVFVACHDLLRLFSDLTEFDPQHRTTYEHMAISSGQALSALSAAHCIVDIQRTRQFIQGIKEAIDDCLFQNPETPVVILYAGTGPFATLFVPLTTMYTPQQLQIVLLEVNPASVHYLKILISKLQLQSYIIDITETDAASYQIPPRLQPDILISETLKQALDKEPFASIVANLYLQCKEGTILIPQTVTIRAALLGMNEDLSTEIYVLGEVLQFTSQTPFQLKHLDKMESIFSDGIKITIPHLQAGFTDFGLLTEIQIYKSHFLTFNESGITIPLILKKISAFEKIPISVNLKYEMGKNPGFRLKIGS